MQIETVSQLKHSHTSINTRIVAHLIPVSLRRYLRCFKIFLCYPYNIWELWFVAKCVASKKLRTTVYMNALHFSNICIPTMFNELWNNKMSCKTLLEIIILRSQLIIIRCLNVDLNNFNFYQDNFKSDETGNLIEMWYSLVQFGYIIYLIASCKIIRQWINFLVNFRKLFVSVYVTEGWVIVAVGIRVICGKRYRLYERPLLFGWHLLSAFVATVVTLAQVMETGVVWLLCLL